MERLAPGTTLASAVVSSAAPLHRRFRQLLSEVYLELKHTVERTDLWPWARRTACRPVQGRRESPNRSTETRTASFQMNRLGHCAIPSRIPNRETNPFLTRGVEGQAGFSAAD